MLNIFRKISIKKSINTLLIRNLATVNTLVNSEKFNKIKNEDINFFKQVIGENGVKTEDLEGFNIDWLKLHQGCSELVLIPKTVDQLSKSLKYCNENNLYVVVQGGNTSLVAGSCPTSNEIVISTSKLNKIISFDEVSGILECESGCQLHELEKFVNDRNYVLPYDLAAKSSFFGGNLASNAGGLNVIRYGNLHGAVLGLETVLMNGEILNLMSTMRKDNTGYDLKQLFIGSEGTLGIITKASILCPIKPKNKLVGILAVDTFQQLLEVFKVTRFNLNEYLSAFEMFDEQIVELLESHVKLQRPFKSKLYILVEMSGSSINEMENQFCNLIENLMDKNLIHNGTYSSELTKMKKLWELRERIAEVLGSSGYCFKYDISIPLKEYYDLVEILRERLKSNEKVTSISGYGHIGDSNLHLSVTCDKFDEKVKNEIEPFVYEWVSERNGSVSSEHGLGLKRNNHIHYSKSPEAIDLMKKIKKILDPKLLLNPQKMMNFK